MGVVVPIIFFLVLIGIVLELAVWVLVAQFISGWYVFFWFIIAGVIGSKMMKSSMSSLMPELQRMQMTGTANFEGVLGKRLILALSGFLLAIPGLISDFFAVLILLPFTQKFVRQATASVIAKRQQKMMDDMMKNMGMGGMGGAGNPFADLMQQMQQQHRQSGQNSTIIDGEAREIQPNVKRIEKK